MPSASPNASKNVLTRDVNIEGTLRFEGECIFDGTIKGEIVSPNGVLTVGNSANINGEVKVKELTICGKVLGNVTASEKCELKSSAQLEGDLKAQRIVIEDGACFVGKSEVSPGKVGKFSEPQPRNSNHHPAAVPAEPVRKASNPSPTVA
ncbi:MAG: polymer-forming cytoskeletal protein [Verrucomicrobia bacterium]|nr:MAG: polymer-forming cytoskeletal protein [Verrucomicrobiota bacterium]